MLEFGCLIDTGDWEGRLVSETKDFVIIVGLSGREEVHQKDLVPYWNIDKPKEWDAENEKWWDEYLALKKKKNLML